RSTAAEEDQLDLADLERVPADQLALLDPLAIEVGAVQRADVVDGEGPLLPAPDLRVPPGHGDVVQEDVALRVPSGGHHVLVEEEPAACVRPATNDQHRRAVTQLLDRSSDLFLHLSLQVLR